jgi:hypothetical protein
MSEQETLLFPEVMMMMMKQGIKINQISILTKLNVKDEPHGLSKDA